MKTLITKNARFIAFFLMGLYLLLMSTGLALQIAAGSYFAGEARLDAVAELALMLVWSMVGALLVSRQPQHPVGWVWLIVPIIVAIDNLTWGYAYYGLFTNPGSLPAVNLMVLWNYWTGRTLGLVPLTVLFLVFPTGRPLSRRWGWLAWIAAGSVAIYMPLSVIAPYPISYFPFPLDILGASAALKAWVSPLRWLAGVIPVLCALLATASLGVRLRRSRGIERQQLKWFVYAAAFFIPGTFLIIISGLQQVIPQNLLFAIGIGVTLLSISGMAVASAIAILRYRLWDIDIIIRRTLVYGALTATLVLVYYASVLLLQNLIATFTQQSQSPLVIVISTLLIAALFTPLRRRIQNGIDRRFYRRRYDAEQTLDAFAARLRQEVNLDQISHSLLAIAAESMQPEHASLWLKPENSERPATPRKGNWSSGNS
jgi:hypothetical protein